MSENTYQLLAAYAVDALTDAERAEVDDYLSRHPEHIAELISLQQTSAALAADTEQPAPPALRESVLRGIAQIRPLPPIIEDQSIEDNTDRIKDDTDGTEEGAGDRPGAVDELAARRRRRPWFLAAAAAAVLGVGALTVQQLDQPSPQQAVPAQVSQAPDATSYALAIPDHAATVTRSRSMAKAVFRSAGLGPAPEGHSYQLWLKQPDGSMVSAGVLPAPEGGVVQMVLHGDAARAVGVGITMEPAGGSARPTTPPLAVTAF